MARHSSGLPIEDALRQFIVAGTSREFDWVSCNCGFWVCDWIMVARGVDPVSELRDRFRTAVGFKRHVTRAGGNEAFSRSIAGRAGLQETDRPGIGDVGLVVTGDGATMAIKATGPNWIGKTVKGVAIGPFSCIVAWKL